LHLAQGRVLLLSRGALRLQRAVMEGLTPDPPGCPAGAEVRAAASGPALEMTFLASFLSQPTTWLSCGWERPCGHVRPERGSASSVSQSLVPGSGHGSAQTPGPGSLCPSFPASQSLRDQRLLQGAARREAAGRALSPRSHTAGLSPGAGGGWQLLACHSWNGC
jgi:hypothetical protein